MGNADEFRNDCGAACVLMLLRWAANKKSMSFPVTTVNQIADHTPLATNGDTGLYPGALVDVAKYYGLNLNLVNYATVQDIFDQIDLGFPVIVEIAYGPIEDRLDQQDTGLHYVVAVGHTNYSIIIHDPDYRDAAGAMRKVPIYQFENAMYSGGVAGYVLMVDPAQFGAVPTTPVWTPMIAGYRDASSVPHGLNHRQFASAISAALDSGWSFGDLLMAALNMPSVDAAGNTFVPVREGKTGAGTGGSTVPGGFAALKNGTVTYLTPVPPPVVVTVTKYVGKPKAGINIRAQADVNSLDVGDLALGTPLTLKAIPTVVSGVSWWELTAETGTLDTAWKLANPGKFGFVHGGYLQDTPVDVTPIPVPVPAPVATVTPWGINIDPYNPAGNPPPSVLKGSAFVRMVFQVHSRWTGSGPEPTIESGFAYYDPIVNVCAAIGVRVIMVLNQQSFAQNIPYQGGGSWTTFTPLFADFARKVADHFGSKVAAFEIFNEPDDVNGMRIPPAYYGNLFRATAARLAGLPVKVLTAGLLSGASDVVTYLKACGDLSMASGFSVHPYGQQPSPPVASLPNMGSLAQYLDIVGRYTLNTPIWITEIGLSVSTQPMVNATAQYMKGIHDLVANYRNVGAVVWYAWSDGQNPGYGIVSATQAHKEPIYSQYMSIIATPPVIPPTPPPVPVPPVEPPPTPPKTGRKRYAGIGIYDPHYTTQLKADFIAMCKRLFLAGTPLAVVLVMDDPDTVQQIFPYVGRVIYRHYAYDSRWEPSRMTDLASANAYAEELWKGWESIRKLLPPSTIIEPVCERDNPNWSGAFFLRWMQLDDADGRGYKCGIFGDSPDQPSISALPSRVEAYRYAMAHGHYYICHDYGLSGTGSIRYWNVLYAQLPADCRPRVLVGEAARANALYVDPPTTTGDIFGYEDDLQTDLYVDGFCHWQYGTSYQNPKYIANQALPSIEAERIKR